MKELRAQTVAVFSYLDPVVAIALSAVLLHEPMDVFGIVINAEYDRKIVGQDYAALSYETSCLSPMVYPSHYADGTYKIEYPDLYPYEVVYASMEESKKLLDEIKVPWIRLNGRLCGSPFDVATLHGIMENEPK